MTRPRALSGLSAFVLAVVLAGPALAQASAVRDCDRLAADRFDPDKAAGVDGVMVLDIYPAAAVPACQAAVAQEPKAGRLWYQLSLALANADRMDEAFKAMTKAGELAHAAAFTAIGYMHQNGVGGALKDDVAAVANYRRAAASGHAIAEANLGNMYWLGAGVPENAREAEAWFKRASDKGFPGAMNGLAWLWAETGQRLPEAEALAAKAIAAEPGNASAIDTLGWAIFKQGRHADAIPHLEKAVAADSQCGPCLEHLGDALLATGNRAGAAGAWRKALEQQPQPKWDRGQVERKLAGAR